LPTSPSSLVNELVTHGFTVNLAGDSVRVVRPPAYPSWEDVPETIRPLLSELKVRQTEVASFLRQRDMARLIHDAALLRLAGECPPGALTWAREQRPDLWGAVLTIYEQVEEAFQAQDFAPCLAAVREFEERNIELFRAFNEAHQSRRLGDMDPEEAEAAIVQVFNARRLDSAAKRDKRPQLDQLSIFREAI